PEPARIRAPRPRTVICALPRYLHARRTGPPAGRSDPSGTPPGRPPDGSFDHHSLPVAVLALRRARPPGPYRRCPAGGSRHGVCPGAVFPHRLSELSQPGTAGQPECGTDSAQNRHLPALCTRRPAILPARHRLLGAHGPRSSLGIQAILCPPRGPDTAGAGGTTLASYPL